MRPESYKIAHLEQLDILTMLYFSNMGINMASQNIPSAQDWLYGKYLTIVHESYY